MFSISRVSDFDHPGTEVNSDSEVMLRPKAFVGKLEKKAGLANASVAYDDIFEEKRVGHSLSEIYY